MMSTSIWQVTGDNAPPTNRMTSDGFTFRISLSGSQRR